MSLKTTPDEVDVAAGIARVGPTRARPWPAEVDFILSAMNAGGTTGEPERRARRRNAYHVKATLRLFIDDVQAPPRVLYTRDVDTHGLGFISPARLPLSYGGVIELVAPTGELLAAHCTLFRCREVSNGWFEGALYFNREQWLFARTDDRRQME